jgi:predicted nucleotidyltransferase
MRDHFRKTHERILRKFLFHGVEFVLIGGHASIYHGVERTTSDLDILVRPTVKNGLKIIEACKDLGLEVTEMAPEDFLAPNVFSFGMSPSSVDILNYSVGVSIDTIFENAIYAKMDELRMKVIDIRDLLANKMAIKRTSDKGLVDQQDIIVLKKIIAWKEKGKWGPKDF